jgi:multidrug efflux system membrane fusion protein
MSVAAAGIRSHGRLAQLIALLIILGGVAAAVYAARRSAVLPSTDDATIDADVVHVAALVGGRIAELAVSENMQVAKGDLLLQIDPVPYRLAVDQATADLKLAEAELATRRRVLFTQQSAAAIATGQTKRAVDDLDLATRTVERLRPLAGKGYVPVQQLDQAMTAEHNAATALQQAREQEAAAAKAIDTEAAAEAAVRAREAALAIAQRALDDTTVRATHAGRVVGLTVSTGEVVAPSQSVFTLVNSEEWYAVGNFREFSLGAIANGDCTTVYSMIDRRHPIKGVVQGIGSGVLDEERVNLPRSVPYVERSLNWVRVAQRFPVRVRLEEPPSDLMRLGASAYIEVKHGSACR